MKWIFSFLRRRRQVIISFVAGGVLVAVLALFTAQMVEDTGNAAFCGTCHEMDVFCDTWHAGPHGPEHKGIAVANCVDCHLPHDGVVSYLTAKGITGFRDVAAHVVGYEPDWIENLEHAESYTYVSGCLKCHVELVAPEISIKAYMAHRDVLTGETSETCISCHPEAGHGNLKAILMERRREQIESP